MDTYADDLSELVETLGLNGAALVGHSAGRGARYIRRHGTRRVAKAVLRTPFSCTGLPRREDSSAAASPLWRDFIASASHRAEARG